jgi:hypothetical protein
VTTGLCVAAVAGGGCARGGTTVIRGSSCNRPITGGDGVRGLSQQQIERAALRAAIGHLDDVDAAPWRRGR